MKKLISIFFLLLIPVLAFDTINEQLDAMDKTLSDMGNKLTSLEHHNSDIDTSLQKVDVFSLANKVWIVLVCILFVMIDFIVTKLVMLNSIPEIVNFLKNTDLKKNQLPMGMRVIVVNENDILKNVLVTEKPSQQQITESEIKNVEIKPKKKQFIESIKEFYHSIFNKKEVKDGRAI